MTLQRALHSIDKAAVIDPSPDLIVLPAFCDLNRVRNGDTSLVERVMGPTLAACGRRARTWGVYVVFGMASREGPNLYATTVLVDPDGDARLIHRQSMFDAKKAGPLSTGPGPASFESIFGRISLLSEEEIGQETCWQQAALTGANFVAATLSEGSPAATVRHKTQAVTQAKRFGIAIAVCGAVVAATADTSNACYILDAAGGELADSRGKSDGLIAATLKAK